VTPSRETEIAARLERLPSLKMVDVAHLRDDCRYLLAHLQQARALTLDLVIEELDHVVMPRDVWVEMRARLDVLRALSPQEPTKERG
jgi:hypothetical protein